MRIAQISDLHLTRITWSPLELFSKRVIGNLNWLLNRNRSFSEDLLISLPQLFDELGVDLVLFGGDFTTTSLRTEFEVGKKFANGLNRPWLAIPGNHDHYTRQSFQNKEFYNYLGNAKEKSISHVLDFFSLKEHGVEAHQLDSSIWIVLLDTARATSLTSCRGLFSQKTERYLDEVLQTISDHDTVLLLNHYPFFQNDHPSRGLERSEALRQLLQKHRKVKLYLHGHTHRHIIADVRESNLPIILDSGSVTQKKSATWNLIDIDEAKIVVSPFHYKEKWTKVGEEEFLLT